MVEWTGPSTQRIGVEDNFFSLGGDSILSIQVVTRARERGLPLSIRSMIEHQTVASLAASVAEVSAVPASDEREKPSATPDRFEYCPWSEEEKAAVLSRYPGAEDAYPLAPLQAGLLYLSLAEGSYVVQRWFQISGGREYLDAFRDGLTMLMARHDSLRTCLVWDGVSEPGQVVLSAEVPEVVRTHLRQDVDRFLEDHGLSIGDISSWVAHPGGPRVLEAMEETLELPPAALELTWQSLERVGNLSSASVLMVLEETMSHRRPDPSSYGILLALGPGFCSELVLLEW